MNLSHTCKSCGAHRAPHQLYCSSRCRRREKMRRYRNRKRQTHIDHSAARQSNPITLDPDRGQLDRLLGTNEELRTSLVRATRLLTGQHRTLATSGGERAQLAQAQNLLSAQRRELEDARVMVNQLHADATLLARAVAQVFLARRWTGYDGSIKEAVERYVQTGQ